MNRTGSLAYDANVDILATAVDLGTNFTGYSRVDGRMLGGQDIPTSRVRTYPSPPSNNTTAPNPVVPPQEGVDVMYAYIDADNASASGLWADVGGRTYGFDYAIAVVGRNGAVNSSGLYAWTANQTNPWKLIAPVAVGLDAHRIEFAVNASLMNLTPAYRVVFYASDWRLEYDLALPDAAVGTIPISIQAATNVVINEVSPHPNPEWIEVANPLATSVSLNGWTLQARGGGNWRTVFTFTNQVLGPFGSGSEYLAVTLAPNSLPDGNGQVRLRQGGTTIDRTNYPASVNNGQSWSRLKDPVTGVPIDTNSNADFYTSTTPSPGQANDRHRPTITVTKAANRATATPGDLIVYTIHYDNTNTGMAKNVWVNDTLPAGVRYTASSVPYNSVSGSTYRWIFASVMPGVHSFTVTAQVTAATTSGQILSNTATLDYTDQIAGRMPRSQAWANTTVNRPMITVVKTATPSSARPGDLVTFTIYYNNTGNTAAGTVTIKDSLPIGMTYQNANPAPTWNNARTFFWNFTNVAPGAHSLTMTARVNATFNGAQLVNWAFLNYTTTTGFALVGSQSSAIVAIPELSDMIFVAAVPLLIIGLKIRSNRRKTE
ncbi:MAG TPA: lamin tail domain-containing protein [Thermoplasmata archaeon]|nr:lamin tail domain-containing protein [Thermoplasmata archaeon]